jgi:hypothetical protein
MVIKIRILKIFTFEWSWIKCKEDQEDSNTAAESMASATDKDHMALSAA